MWKEGKGREFQTPCWKISFLFTWWAAPDGEQTLRWPDGNMHFRRIILKNDIKIYVIQEDFSFAF